MKAVNLLPSDKRSAAKLASAAPKSPESGSAFGAWVVIGALAFAVVAMGAYVLTTNAVKDRESQLARVKAEATAMQAKAAQLQSFADFKTIADGRIATVKGLAKSRFDWERTLRDLSKALPGDVHLNSLSGTTGTQTTPDATATSAIQAPSLTLSGCAADQKGVARLMSRLRLVRGVTRVSLTKSDKDGALGVVSTIPGTEGGSLCPKGAPPAFEMAIYFERSALGKSATPNVGAATPASAATSPQGGGAARAGAVVDPDSNAGVSPGTAPSASAVTQGVSAK